MKDCELMTTATLENSLYGKIMTWEVFNFS